MSEYIDRDRFVMETQRRICANCDKRKGIKNGKYRVIYDIGDAPCRACGVDDMISEVEDFPEADVWVVVHGRWIPQALTAGFKGLKCSVCNSVLASFAGTNYCPNCGAKMDGEDNA